MTARNAVKRAIGRLALAPLVAPIVRASLRRRINVVYLHYVGEPRPYYDGYYCGSTIERFADHLALLARHFEFATLQEVVSGAGALDGEAPRLAVTFDDGFDLISNGTADVLERHGISATTFVVVSTLDNANLMWRNKVSAICSLGDPGGVVNEYNRLAAAYGMAAATGITEVLRRSENWPSHANEDLADTLWQRCGLPPLDEFLDEHRPYFTWEGLRAWLARGHAVGFHTATHPYCDRIGGAEIEAEIVRPAALLREQLDIEFLPFSYPFGVRLPAEIERDLYERGVYDCALGIRGFARTGTPPFGLERAPIECEVRFSVFGNVLLGRP